MFNDPTNPKKWNDIIRTEINRIPLTYKEAEGHFVIPEDKHLYWIAVYITPSEDIIYYNSPKYIGKIPSGEEIEFEGDGREHYNKERLRRLCEQL